MLVSSQQIIKLQFQRVSLLLLFFDKIDLFCSVIEITFTVFASYLVYWLGEELGISGVISVVVLGLKLRADSTSISPEVEKMVNSYYFLKLELKGKLSFVGLIQIGPSLLGNGKNLPPLFSIN